MVPYQLHQRRYMSAMSLDLADIPGPMDNAPDGYLYCSAGVLNQINRLGPPPPEGDPKVDDWIKKFDPLYMALHAYLLGDRLLSE